MKTNSVIFFFVFSIVRTAIEKNPGAKLYQDVFNPKELEQDPIDELENDLDFDDVTEISLEQPSNFDFKKFSSLDSFFHFILANKVLKPTLSEESSIEIANPLQFPYEFIANLNFNYSLNKSNNTWRLNGNVCNSKVVYLHPIEIYHEYRFDFRCEQRIDSEICEVFLTIGSRNYTIHITTFCCPGYELKNNSCIQTSFKDSFLHELYESIEVINMTVTGYLELSDIDLYSDVAQEFYQIFNKVSGLLEGGSKAKLTIFLWDNRIFLDKINQLFNSDHYEINEILNEINLILINHVVDFQHPTQSLMSNTKLLGNLRIFRQNINNVSRFFANCFEIDSPNNYYKKLNGPHEYQLIIHKLEEGSLLLPGRETMFDKLESSILLTTRSFKIFREIFNKNTDLLFTELSSFETYKTLFIPSDRAFQKLTDEEIESIITDEKCSVNLVKKNLLKENICPKQLYKHNEDFETSLEFIVENLGTDQIATYKPWFKTVIVNDSKSLFFDNQQVLLQKSILTANGVIYAINSLSSKRINLLNNIIESFMNRISPSFIRALNKDWRQIIRENSNNCTLLLPGLKYFLSNPIKNSIMIQDYIFKPKFYNYELENGQVITSINRKIYLVNSIETSKKTFDLFTYLPKKYFYAKYINCQEIEESQISGCNSELSFFNSHLNFIPGLNHESLLSYLQSDNEFVHFNLEISRCGQNCEFFLLDLEKSSKKNSTGFTLFLPINNFTSNNLIFEMKKRIFYNTLCESMLINENFQVENLFNRKLNSNILGKWIHKSQAYLSRSGILIHKVFWF